VLGGLFLSLPLQPLCKIIKGKGNKLWDPFHMLHFVTLISLSLFHLSFFKLIQIMKAKDTSVMYA